MGNNNVTSSSSKEQRKTPSVTNVSFQTSFRNRYPDEVQAAVAQETRIHVANTHQQVCSTLDRNTAQNINIQIQPPNSIPGLTVTISKHPNKQNMNGSDEAQSSQCKYFSENLSFQTSTANVTSTPTYTPTANYTPPSRFTPVAEHTPSHPPFSELYPQIKHHSINTIRGVPMKQDQVTKKAKEIHSASSPSDISKSSTGMSETLFHPLETVNTSKKSVRIQSKESSNAYVWGHTQVSDVSKSVSAKSPSNSDVKSTIESKAVIKNITWCEGVDTHKPSSTYNQSLLESDTDTVKDMRKSGAKIEVFETVSKTQKERCDNSKGSCLDREKFISRGKSTRTKGIPQEARNIEGYPPNNFRNISIFPTSIDLFSNDVPFLTKIRTEGAYNSVEQYLDIHFRLLKEDFVRPFREGIKMYLEGNTKKLKNIRVYKKTYFTKLALARNKVGLAVSFDPDKLIQREKSVGPKKLLSGSLLCFSDNNFKDILFATVIESGAFLQEGLVVVEIIDMKVHTRNELLNRPFVMIESKVYFEPYFHVLTALQNIYPSDFPMAQYIIEAQTVRAPPDYLLNSVTGESKKLTISGTNVHSLDYKSWPNAAHLNLDESQYSAFITALTEKIVLIQGAPGTGKTFLVLKLIEVLLQNKAVWRSQNAPILVICFSNYALDQILEGVMSFTSDVVRVGGQSKNESIKHLNLKEKWKQVNNSTPSHTLLSELKDDLTCIASSVKQTEKAIEIISNNCGILSVSSFENCIPKRHLNSFLNEQNELDDNKFLSWLESGINKFSSTVDNQSPEFIEKYNFDSPSKRYDSENLYLDFEDETPNKIDIDVDLDENMESSELIHFAVDFRLSEKTIFDLKSIIKQIKQTGGERNLCEVQNFEKDLKNVMLKLKYFQDSLAANQKHVEDPLSNFLDLWRINSDQRWFLYKEWVAALKTNFIEDLQNLELSYASKFKRFEDAKFLNDYEILKNSSVVGMTSAAAAYYQPMLKRLNCSIVFVEEAAELLESHVTVALTNHCQHLILIGDDKYLQPSTNVYELRQNYNLHLSLFQRMINNGMHCETLKVQRRMRPEIARLLVPAIYPKLINHKSVRKYGSVEGVAKNVFFITHKHYEEEVPELKGFRNPHEGDFLIAFCRHLILQGYAAEKITILTTYCAQLFYIEKKQTADISLKNVKLARVDNYKGEENDIILLSLVRSNSKNDIGFLKFENRVCVALTRAKKGLYIIGNMDCLTAGGNVWTKIASTLRSEQALGSKLPLKCQIHNEQLTLVSSASDFNDLPGGGCELSCKFQLSCGHTCPLSCHVNDRDHSKFRCTEPCKSSSKCKVGYHCAKICFEDCNDPYAKVQKLMPCGHTLELPNFVDPQQHKCSIKVSVALQCGHKVDKPCHQKTELTQCPHPCENRLQCGHKCLRRCHIRHDPDHLKYQCRKPCGRKNVGCKENHICEKACHEECSPCLILVKQVLPECGHSIEMPCSQYPNNVECQMDCEKMLPCGHRCKKRCNEPCGKCQLEVTKTFKECGHSVKVKCSIVPNPNKCKRPCERLLPCGHKCRKACGKECGTACEELVLTTEPGLCGHKLTVPCNLNEPGNVLTSQQILKFCKEPCKTVLECGHECRGNCGSCFQRRVHKSCQEECGKILICGHKCTFPCSENCPPCSKQCSHRCRHSKCSNYCGQPCTPCMEKCGWQCEHKKCTRFCHELCNRDACYEPCKITLKCGHKCIGYCGDPCPELCRFCNRDEVTTIVFGHEDEIGARFVLLEDCGHNVESRGIEKWLKESGDEITMKVCPICRTPITRTQRFMNIVKITLKDICDVKAKVFGILNEIEEKRSALDKQISQLIHMSSFAIQAQQWHKYLGSLKQQLLPVQGQRRNQLSIMDTASLELHIQFLQEIVMALRHSAGGLDTYSLEKVEQQLLFFMQIMETRGRYLSNQEVKDINCEVNRFNSLIELCRLESTKMYKMHCNNSFVQKVYDTARMTICSVQKFTPRQQRIFKLALTKLNNSLHNPIVISTLERQQILKAMNLKQGHWYKCPNGHIYVITECGRAMQISKCNECGAQIGGRRHTLLPTNRAATEME